MTGDNDGPAGIAIVGMAMRLPGGVRTAEEFWELLINKRDCSSEVPNTRYNVDAFYHPNKPQSVRTRRGYFLEDEYLGKADMAFFYQMGGFTASELDPQQMLLMEVVWECMENAGQSSWRGTDIGCYVGTFGEDWHELMAKETQAISRVHAFANGGFALANRVSYEFDLKGPSATIMTACSSSLMALHEACQALQNGDCSSAIVAGANMLLTPSMTVNMSENMVLSPDGYCKTFDASANGYARGEAVNVIYIKTLDQALADGDRVRAVIRATSANYDGRTDKIFAPDIDSQERLIRKAYERARIHNIKDTAFIECHGTGTKVGDIVEANAIARVFGPHSVYIGSVKSNVGHGEGASGLTGVIKSVLALERHIIPPNMHFVQPNPKIPFGTAGLRVPTEPTPWPLGRKERVGVNCFGIGGSNVHAILESLSTADHPSQNTRDKAPLRPRLLVISAHSKTALDMRQEDMQLYLKRCPEQLGNIAYTLGVRRDHLPHRAYTIADGVSTTGFRQVTNDPSRSPASVIFTFTGQGAQWVGMGRELINNFPCVQRDVQAMDKVLQELSTPPRWSIEGELQNLHGENHIDCPEYAQTLCAAVQITLVNLLKGWGIHPSGVIGHSSGEVIAAYGAGAITMRTAIITAHLRGQCVGGCSGAMAVVGLGLATVTSFLIDGVAIACENSPQSVNISGDQEKVITVLDQIKVKYPSAFIRQLPVSVAYHSPDMCRVGPAFESTISPYITHNDAMVPMYSTVTGARITDPGELNAAYWRKNLESPVQFNIAVQELIAQSPASKFTFLEIGPHPTLSGPLRQILTERQDTQSTYIPTLRKQKNQVHCLLEAAGQAFLNQCAVNFEAINGKGAVLSNLPVYKWDRQDAHWRESRVSQSWRFRQHPHHELLGSRILEGSDLEPAWRVLLSTRNVSWLNDHRLLGETIFPCAGYIAMINEAMFQLFNTQECTIRNLLIQKPLHFPDSDPVELITTARPVRISDRVSSKWYEFTIVSYNGKGWVKHTTGQAKAGVEERPPAADISQAFPRLVSSDFWYGALEKLGLEYGPHFRVLQDITADPMNFRATAIVHGDSPDQRSNLAVHPTVIDACLQLFSVAGCKGKALCLNKLCIPTFIDKIHIGRNQPVMNAEAWGDNPTSTEGRGTVVLAADQQHVLSMHGVSIMYLGHELRSEEGAVPLASCVEWRRDLNFTHSDQQPASLKARDEASGLINELSIISIIQVHRLIENAVPGSEALQDYQLWIQSQVRDMQNACYPAYIGPECLEWIEMDDDTLQRQRHICSEALKARGLGFIPQLSQCVVNASLDVVKGLVDPSTLEIQEQFNELHSWALSIDPVSEWLYSLRHCNPLLRVLEVGSARGAFSSDILDCLVSDKMRYYSLYTWTEASEITSAAEEQLGDYKQVVFKRFRANSYDLILGSNVDQLRTALQNIKKLLGPRGRLLLRQPTPGNIASIVNNHTSLALWRTELQRTGFNMVEGDMCRNCLYYNIISQVPDDEVLDQNPIYLLCRSKMHCASWICAVEMNLEQKGYEVRRCTIGEEIPFEHQVISLLDVEEPFFKNASEESWKSFQQFVGYSPRVLWVTKAVELSCPDPDFSLVLGVSRTARLEQGLHFGTLQIDNFDSVAAEALGNVAKRFFRQFEGDVGMGAIYIPRVQWTSLQDQLHTDAQHDMPVKLDIDSYGLIDTLSWAIHEYSNVGPDDVEVDIKYVGLNFRDIMIALGVMADKSEFGVEASGVIRQCGSNVKELQTGDRVLISRPGLFHTVKSVPASLCTRLPPSLSFQDAAAMMVAYGTALYCLTDIARLEKGQSVLIHAACGGVGLAAVQLCRIIGAEIYATVGSEAKALYLVENHCIPRHHIFNSRNTSFLPDLMRETKGQGVDVVLNSLAGELLHASWQCVAEFGKMVEIGKRDFEEHGSLDLKAFGGNRAFLGVDLIRLIERPGWSASLAQRILALYEQGKIQPVRPLKEVAAAEVHKAFRYMQQGHHIGKIVVRMPRSAKEVAVAKSRSNMALSPDVAYLLVGGLGGVGRSLASWMVERGARHLIFLSRSAGDSRQDRSFVCELEAQGCSATLVRGDVAVLEDVQTAIRGSGYPIGGVLLLTMVVKDQLIPDMTYQNWQDVLAVKVAGAWNIHHALDGQDSCLQFFVVCGSITGVMGNAGQVNYSAANAFLASFAQYRLDKGLPASVVNLGAVDDIGFLATKDRRLRDRMRSAAVRLLREQEVLDAFEIAMSQCRSKKAALSGASGLRVPNNVIVGMSNTKSLVDPSVRTLWGQDARFSAYANIDTVEKQPQHSANSVVGLQKLFQSAKNNPELLNDPSQAAMIVTEIVKAIQEYSIFARGQEYDHVAATAIDSLMTVEIRNWSKRYLNLDLPLSAIAQAGTIGGLGELVLVYMRSKYLKS
ncbi:type I polyketide synthase [Aspergillus alliaceus]|uniref:type I polyketide synthase n=1 Tax=Petromyces alliaceus TaxID=209559 RepID=UPI0012A6EEBA|nr:putative polyketide synthase [Aspergillus alliaceus]KAB8229925.1 putative polyketide synthase [Aspergillus alliaceus]